MAPSDVVILATKRKRRMAGSIRGDAGGDALGCQSIYCTLAGGYVKAGDCAWILILVAVPLFL